MWRALDLPPVWLALFALAGWGLVPALDPPAVWRWAGFLVLAAGLALMVWAALTMRRARTTIIPGRRPEALVTSGPFGYSRNPIYLADLLLFAGLMLASGRIAGLLLVPVLALVLQQRFIRHEEEVIARAFPDAYSSYRQKVRRWI
ncbi:isoprenylcysteine carboxylmethyltransferase family protein [Paracoccus sp. (in: a-proteobacteria)]|uniref:methyltransferase family protein n=1 Tax=Paracoccus sp. TaxID=267 RepID=UPI003220385E